MTDLRSEMPHLYHVASRLSSGLQNMHSSIRSFGHLCRAHMNRFPSHNHINNNNNNNNNNPYNSSNPFIDNNEIDPNIQSTPTMPVDSSSNSANIHRTLHHQRNPCRSSSRIRRCRDREYRNAYHLYRNGLISVRTLDKDRNVLAAVLSIIVIAVLATALAQPKWFSIYNDLCAPITKSDTSEKVSNINDEDWIGFPTDRYIQYRPQYYNGPLHSIYSSSIALAPVTIYGLTPDYKSCANPQILALKRTIIGLCFLAIMCTLVQFFMDTMGTRRKWVNSMRIYAVGNIVCVLLCILVIGLCYFISVLYERVQLQQLFSKTLPAPYGPSPIWIKNRIIGRSLANNHLDYLTIHQIEVKFELSYYLVTLAGFLSILASAANLFRRPRQIFIERINEVNNCRSRPLRNVVNGDENSLLGSDVLNNTGTETPTNQFLPPYHFSPNEWLFNNWNVLYNTRNFFHTNSNSNQNHNRVSSSNNPASTIVIPPVPVPCPPPPPYSP